LQLSRRSERSASCLPSPNLRGLAACAVVIRSSGSFPYSSTVRRVSWASTMRLGSALGTTARSPCASPPWRPSPDAVRWSGAPGLPESRCAVPTPRLLSLRSDNRRGVGRAVSEKGGIYRLIGGDLRGAIDPLHFLILFQRLSKERVPTSGRKGKEEPNRRSRVSRIVGSADQQRGGAKTLGPGGGGCRCRHRILSAGARCPPS
jgi:hypothetical protein